MLFVCGKTLDQVEANLILKFPSWGFTLLSHDILKLRDGYIAGEVYKLSLSELI